MVNFLRLRRFHFCYFHLKIEKLLSGVCMSITNIKTKGVLFTLSVVAFFFTACLEDGITQLATGPEVIGAIEDAENCQKKDQGMQVFAEADSTIYFCNGSEWVAMTTSSRQSRRNNLAGM